MKKINVSQIPDSISITIVPLINGFEIRAGCQTFICPFDKFIPVMELYKGGYYKEALIELGVEVDQTFVSTNIEYSSRYFSDNDTSIMYSSNDNSILK